MRSALLQQLKDLKALRDDDVLTTQEYAIQKAKLVTELSSL